MRICRLINSGIVILVCFCSQLGWTKSFPMPSSNTMIPHLPRVFEKNQGQVAQNFSYLAQTPETYFRFARDRVDLLLNTSSDGQFPNLLRIQFPDSTGNPDITGLNRTRQYVNYLRGQASQWIKQVATFKKIEYSNIFPGIDLQFYFTKTRMEFDFIVSPGADPQQIAFEIKNADKIKINATGALEIQLGKKKLFFNAPHIYQVISGKQQLVSGNFTQKGERIGFVVGEYNSKYSLLIDPVIEFSSYFGGEWEDQANVVKLDSLGNIYLAGATSAAARITSANVLTSEAIALPTLENVNTQSVFQKKHGISLPENIVSGGASLDLNTDAYDCDYRNNDPFGSDVIVVDYDAFISKFDSNFNPIYTTYLGGCRNESIRAMAIDSDNEIYVTGTTLSSDFPLKSPAQDTLTASRFKDDPAAGEGDAFYAKFSSEGELKFSSYLGGDGQDTARDIAIDDSKNIYLLGFTRSLDKLLTTPCPDVGTRAIACNYIGGINEAANEAGSSDVSLFADVFIARISATGDVINYMSYFGGSSDDWGEKILWRKDGDDADTLDDIYIAGNTASRDLPVGESGDYSFMPYNINQSNEVVVADRRELLCSRLRDVEISGARTPDAHACRDVFFAKLSIDENGVSKIQFLTYFGGDNDDGISDIDVDSQGNIYLFGTTESAGVRLDSGDKNALNKNLETRFPLYKNINEYAFDINSNSTYAFFTVFFPGAEEMMISSFIGGNKNDTGNALLIRDGFSNTDGDPLVDVYLSGNTLSDSFFVKDAFQSEIIQSDIYLSKFTINLARSKDLYDPGNPDNPNLCSRNSCNLYDIKYSTLLGGEDLDSVKDMAMLADGSGLLMTGITFSRQFPVSNDALKGAIKEMPQKVFSASTGALIDEFVYYPSDAYLMKIIDTDEMTDLSLSLNLLNTGDIKENEFMRYAIKVENNSLTLAKSVRLLVKYPYVAKKEELGNYLSIDTLDADACIIDIKQMYCLLGDFSANEARDFILQIKTPVSGDFLLTASISSMTANSNTDVSKAVNAKVGSNAGSLAVWLILLFCLGLVFRKNPDNNVIRDRVNPILSWRNRQ